MSMTVKVRIEIITDDSYHASQRSYEAGETGIWTNAREMLAGTIDIALGPHVVADDVADEQTGF